MNFSMLAYIPYISHLLFRYFAFNFIYEVICHPLPEKLFLAHIICNILVFCIHACFKEQAYRSVPAFIVLSYQVLYLPLLLFRAEHEISCYEIPLFLEKAADNPHKSTVILWRDIVERTVC